MDSYYKGIAVRTLVTIVCLLAMGPITGSALAQSCESPSGIGCDCGIMSCESAGCQSQNCARQAHCGSNCCGCDKPMFEFIDDLRCFPYGTSTRDPYEERIETERHDFTQSTKTVGRRVLQVEAGYSYFYKDENDEIENTHTTPEGLIRYGLSDDIEFRMRWSYDWRFVDAADNRDSAQDMVLSLKLAVTEECGWVPQSVLELRSSIPTGGNSFTLGRIEGGVDYIYSWEIAEGTELYGSTGYLGSGLGEISLLPTDVQSDHFGVWTQSVALGYEVTEKSVFYAEWFGLFSYGRSDEISPNFFNVGVDYYVNEDFVLDIRFGMGLNADSDDFFSGIGGGYRF